MRPPRSIGDETALEARCARGVPAEASRPTRPGPTGGARVVLVLAVFGSMLALTAMRAPSAVANLASNRDSVAAFQRSDDARGQIWLLDPTTNAPVVNLTSGTAPEARPAQGPLYQPNSSPTGSGGVVRRTGTTRRRKASPRLSIRGARWDASRVTVVGESARGLGGRVRVAFSCGHRRGQHTQRKVRARSGRFGATMRATRACRRARLGVVVAAYGGDRRYRGQRVSRRVRHRSSPPVLSAGANLGCHQYCSIAGGYGGGESGRPATDFVRIRSARLGGGALLVTVACLERTACRGAILVSPAYQSDLDVMELGRSDLVVGGQRTRTIAVPLSPRGLRALRTRHGQRFPIDVLVDFGDPSCPPASERPCVLDRRVIIDTGAAG